MAESVDQQLICFLWQPLALLPLRSVARLHQVRCSENNGSHRELVGQKWEPEKNDVEKLMATFSSKRDTATLLGASTRTLGRSFEQVVSRCVSVLESSKVFSGPEKLDRPTVESRTTQRKKKEFFRSVLQVTVDKHSVGTALGSEARRDAMRCDASRYHFHLRKN